MHTPYRRPRQGPNESNFDPIFDLSDKNEPKPRPFFHSFDHCHGHLWGVCNTPLHGRPEKWRFFYSPNKNAPQIRRVFHSTTEMKPYPCRVFYSSDKNELETHQVFQSRTERNGCTRRIRDVPDIKGYDMRCRCESFTLKEAFLHCMLRSIDQKEARMHCK